MRETRDWLLVAAALFISVAWPLAFVDLPPLQDLPNHLATAEIIQHPELYPEYVFNGFLKTNSVLFAWLVYVGKIIGLHLAAKLFVLLVLLVNALVLPRLVLEIGGRDRMVTSSLLAWPLVHNWFVSMGMLDYALGCALALVVIILLVQQARAPTRARWAAIACLAVLLWWVHAFALAVCGLIATVHVASTPDRRRGFSWLLLPLAPAGTLFVVSLVQQLDFGRHDVIKRASVYAPPWELVYNAWSEFLWGFTNASISSIVAALAMAFFVWRSRKEDVSVLSRTVMVVLGVFYFLAPYHAAHWFFVCTRFLPFLWACALVRVPDRLPRWMAGVLASAWLAYSIGMGIDYIRLDGAWKRFTAGEAVVPKNATVLPLMFEYKEISVNTRNMLQVWGLYAADRDAHIPLVFAHSRSFPLLHRDPPPLQLHELRLENFPRTMKAPEEMCDAFEMFGITTLTADCAQHFTTIWRDFWDVAEPRYDYVLTYAAKPEALGHIPTRYRLIFDRDLVRIYAHERVGASQ